MSVKLPNARTCAMIKAAAEQALNATELARAADFDEKQAWTYADRAVEAGWMTKDESGARPVYRSTPDGCNKAVIATNLQEDRS